MGNGVEPWTSEPCARAEVEMATRMKVSRNEGVMAERKTPPEAKTLDFLADGYRLTVIFDKILMALVRGSNASRDDKLNIQKRLPSEMIHLVVRLKVQFHLNTTL